MSTLVEDKPVETITELPQHTVVIGKTRFWCIQPDCDGEHHFYCSCAH